MSVIEISIIVKDVTLNLSVKEARDLQDKLNDLFNTVTVPSGVNSRNNVLNCKGFDHTVNNPFMPDKNGITTCVSDDNSTSTIHELITR